MSLFFSGKLKVSGDPMLATKLSKLLQAARLSEDAAAPSRARARRGCWGAALVALATGLRVAWVLAVPTVPVSDFAMYRESANYLSEFGSLDPGFIYMPGFVALLAWVKNLGGDLLAQKLIGVAFGGLGAAGLFALSYRLLDDRIDDDAGRPPCRWRRFCPCPRAATATLLYALWPAGVAMSSVVGTDVPAAALLALALALLVTLAPAAPAGRRRWRSASRWGWRPGSGRWRCRCRRWRSATGWRAGRSSLRALLLTGVGVAATLVVLLPWGIRHVRQSGAAVFHRRSRRHHRAHRRQPELGGDVHARAQPHVQGRHRPQRARRAAPRDRSRRVRHRARVVSLRAALRAGAGGDEGRSPVRPRTSPALLVDLLRPGVLVGPRAQWLAARRGAITGAADGFGLAGRRAGAGGCRGGRRAPALAAAGAGAVPARAGRDVHDSSSPSRATGCRSRCSRSRSWRWRWPRSSGGCARAGVRRSRAGAVHAAQALVPALVLVVVWRVAWPAVARLGHGLRARHRWAVTEAELDGRKRLLLWARQAPAAGRASPLAGAPEGVHVRDGGDGARSRCACGWAAGRCRPATTRSHFRLEAGAGDGAGSSSAARPATLAAGAPATLDGRDCARRAAGSRFGAVRCH